MSTERPSEVFARAVRELREARPKGSRSQEWLARRLMEVEGVEDERKLGSYRVMVSRTESGRRTPTLDDLFLFAKALDANPWMLFRGSDLALERQMQETRHRAKALQGQVEEIVQEISARLLEEEQAREER